MRMTSLRRHSPLLVLALAAVIAAVTLAASGFAFAHHSNAMFDKAKLMEVTVTVKEFQWTNPHIWIQVYLDNEEGEQEEWSIEGGGPNSLFRKGWRPDSFKPGEVVEIKFNPMLDGSNAALFIGARFSSGATLGNW